MYFELLMILTFSMSAQHHRCTLRFFCLMMGILLLRQTVLFRVNGELLSTFTKTAILTQHGQKFQCFTGFLEWEPFHTPWEACTNSKQRLAHLVSRARDCSGLAPWRLLMERCAPLKLATRMGCAENKLQREVRRAG